jgi:hypothetical protein
MEPENGQVWPKLVSLIFNKEHNITLAVDGYYYSYLLLHILKNIILLELRALFLTSMWLK